MHILGIIAIISVIITGIRNAFTKSVPAENWANKELMNEDRLKGMSEKEIFKNVEASRYKITQTFPEPHRDPKTGKIIIENSTLYYDDVKKYGAHQAQQWVKQGKYNLTPEELKKEHERWQKDIHRLKHL